MKRSIPILIILFAMFCFTSCNKDREVESLLLKDDYFEYPQKIDFGFDVDHEGVLYYLALEDSSETVSGSLNEETDENPSNAAMLYSIDSDGNQLESFLLGKRVIGQQLVIEQGNAYYTSLDLIESEGGTEEAIFLYEYNIESGLNREIYRFIDYQIINSIEVIDGYIYFLGIDKNCINKKYTLAGGDDTYIYGGEVLGVVDIKAGTMTEIPIAFPVSFSKTMDNNLMIYAHDGEGGYYFMEYNAKDGNQSDKTYHNLDRMSEFDIFNYEKDFIFTAPNIARNSLSSSSIKEGIGIVEIMPDVFIYGTNSIVCQGGYTFYRNLNSYKIERIRNSDYIREGKTIRMINTQYFENDPFGCGYTIERERTDEESFALAVLSQDDSFDLCLMDSRQDISANIRDKGSFYALNEVEGVSEYMDACFPYIKDIATTEDGDIWMLPLEVDVPCLLYNEPLCSEQGIDLSIPMNLEAFVSLILKLNGDEEFKDKYSISGYVLRENIFCQYLRAYEDFDNDYFRELASFFKENLNYQRDEEKWRLNANVMNQIAYGKGEKVLFEYEYYYTVQSLYGERNPGFRAGDLPHITEDKSNIATCLYLCVNLASKNLNETIRYISSLCVYLTEHNDTMLFSDRLRYPDAPIYNDLYKIYENADIQFTLPGDIFISDFHAYLMDEIDLDTLAEEAQRKVNAYRKE